jgi:arsenite/tail-anchored protein-transporting ATPase
LNIVKKRVYHKASMGLAHLTNPLPRLIMVGGKGGVGKTTCASAIALGLALDGKKVLLISSDPTPSLSDIFDMPIGGSETAIAQDCPLFGLEISSDMVLKRWKERFGQEIYEVVSSFASVDYDFVDYIGTAPGIEEEYMLNFIMELVDGGAYDTVVWDTAPAGHTLRLLRLPQLFLRHMEAATKFYLNMHGYLDKLRDALSLKGPKRSVLDIISSWEALSEKIVAFIRDGERTKYLLVTIPEALGVKLTVRMIEELAANRLHVENIVINNVVRDGDCEFHRRRKAMQEEYIRFIADSYPEINRVILYLSAGEVRGRDSIEEIALALSGKVQGTAP